MQTRPLGGRYTRRPRLSKNRTNEPSVGGGAVAGRWQPHMGMLDGHVLRNATALGFGENERNDYDECRIEAMGG